MRVTELTLENIKSYSRLTIPLTGGLNAICGLNGSGKTTLLEAIGFTLFDFLPYSQQAFLREGEKTGTIRLRLLARDEREYEVVRRIGAGSTYYVSDVETGMRVVDRPANVKDWVAQQVLGVDGDIDLGSLFQNAVGVPQGLMTTDFQGTAGQRKAVFDPLLRVEEYRVAWNRLREALSHLNSLTEAVKVEIAGMETDVLRIPSTEMHRGNLAVQVDQATSSLQRLAGALENLQRQKKDMDQRAESLRKAEEALRATEVEVQNLEGQYLLRQQLLDSATRAAHVVEQNRESYERVVASKRRLMELEQSRVERDSCLRKLAASRAEETGVRAKLTALEARIEEARQADNEAQQLAPAEIQQVSLEAKLLEATMHSRDLASTDQQITRIEAQLADARRGLNVVQQRLVEARTAQTAAAGLTASQQDLSAIQEKLVALRSVVSRREELMIEGKELRRQRDALSDDVHRRADLAALLESKRQAAGGLEQLQSESQALRDESSRLESALNYHGLALRELERRHCPLLDTTCPVVASDATQLSRLGRTREDLETQVKHVAERLSELGMKVIAARKAHDEAQQIELSVAELSGVEIRLRESEQRLAVCREKFHECEGAVIEVQALQSQHEVLAAQVAQLQQAAKVADQLDMLGEQERELRDRTEALAGELTEFTTRRNALAEGARQGDLLRSQLDELGDVRAKRQALLALASCLDELAAEKSNEASKLAVISDSLQEIEARLQVFDGLDARLQEQREIETANCQAHEVFLANRDEALQVKERQETVSRLWEDLVAAKAAALKGQELFREINAQYDAAQHEKLIQKCGDVGREVAVETTNRKHWADRLKELEAELARLRVQEGKIGRRREEFGALQETYRAVEFIRTTIAAAGPAVAEVVLANISQTADEIYGEIMNDHAAELSWNPEYEVLIQRGSEVRRFNQLSGGEQMSAALALRLALLKEMSEVNFACFDEPTQNMDSERRANLADQIGLIRGFEQLVVISHDDTFEHQTDNLVRLRKVHEQTELEAG